MTVRATSREPNVASRNAAAMGAKKLPCNPGNIRIGRNTIPTINVASTIGRRTSIEAFNITASSGVTLRNLTACRRRRTMFSTSMIASSTTTPSATARPLRVIVLMVQPIRFITSTANSRDKGMVTNEISAVRQLRRNTINTSATSKAPIASASRMLFRATSINVAGRCKAEYTVTPRDSSIGCNSASAASSR